MKLSFKVKRTYGDNGGVGGSKAYLISSIQLDDTHINVNSPENDPKAARTESSQLNREAIKNGRKGRDAVRNQADRWGCPWEGHSKHGEGRGTDPTLGTPVQNYLHWEDESPSHLALKTRRD